MKKVLLIALLSGSLLVINLQFSSILNPVNPHHSSISQTQNTVFCPNIDPIGA